MQGECKRKKRDRVGGLSRFLSLTFFRPRVPRSEVSPPVASAEERAAVTSHEILIGYVLSDAPFNWLVGNMSVCQENLFQSRSLKKQHFPSFFESSLTNIL